MPVELRTLHGKVDHVVEQQIRDLVFAINEFEQRLQALRLVDPATLATLQRTVGNLEARVAQLNQRVDALENP